MPKLWRSTIEAHRTDVREAILDSAAELVARHGVRGVSMSRIAEATGISRGTLYAYFGGVEEILLAWHERQVARHLAQLAELRDRAGSPRERLEAVLDAYAAIRAERHRHGEAGPAALLHGERVTHAEEQLRQLVGGLIAEAAASGDVRGDVAPAELAGFCLHALGAAGQLPSRAATRRLVGVVLDALR